jgi:hypothetical protein
MIGDFLARSAVEDQLLPKVLLQAPRITAG